MVAKDTEIKVHTATGSEAWVSYDRWHSVWNEDQDCVVVQFRPDVAEPENHDLESVWIPFGEMARALRELGWTVEPPAKEESER